MIQKFTVTHVHTNLDDRLEKYINKKLGNLDKYVPRRMRDTARAEVLLKEDKALKSGGSKNPYTCEVTLHLPHQSINVSESMPNMYSAVDIVEAKLKQAIVKYKEQHAPGALRRRLAGQALDKTSG